MGPLEVQTLDSMRRIMEVNLLGTIQTIQAFLSDMKAQGGGHILVTGSTGGLHGEMSKCLRNIVQLFGFFLNCLIKKNNPETDPVYALSAMLEIAKTTHLITSCSLTGLPFNEVYCASKFAIEGACESLAVLLQHFNIQ